MEVVRKNFKEALPLISESIKKADYLSIDTELTGLLSGRDVSIFDSPEEYYIHLLNGCSNFMLIQFGLCAFYWDENKKHYMNDAYNFYLFPRRPDKMFLCQSSSLEFLSANSFDFNKLIKEGIPYITEPIETKLRETLTEKQLNSSIREKEHLKIPDENKQLIEDLCTKVKAFIDDKQSDEMEIEKVNGFIRLLLFQELRGRFKDDIFVDTKILENKSRILKVTRRKEGEEIVDHEAVKRQKEWDDLEDAVGFSKVARMISQSEKLVIGHNMVLDVIHTLNHFFQPLPADYASFKEFAHCMFPKLIDTKYVSSLPPFKDKMNSNALAEVLATLKEAPFSLPKVGCLEGRGYLCRDEKCHEAGYDAYITGLCFLGMHSHLQRMRGEQTLKINANSAVIKPFLNKLFLARTARQDSPYINLSGPDPSPSRDHVFHLSFPKEWQRNDIIQLFSPFGPVVVNFLDDTSAYVALERRDNAPDVQRTLSRHARISVTSYYSYKKSISQTDLDENPYKMTNKLRDSSPRTGMLSGMASPQASPNPPTKISRVHSNSTSMAAPVHTSPPARKRTSSGIFQVDDSEPLPKKSELTRSLSDSPRKKSEAIANGCQKIIVKEKIDKKEKATEKKEGKQMKELKKTKIVVTFDSEAKSKCVSAFKESDNWD